MSSKTMENGCPPLVNGSKGKGLWKKVKYQLVEYHSLPGFLRDNEYILDHYRSEWPLKQVLLSIFSIHNETLNVWTYGFYPICYFISIHRFSAFSSLFYFLYAMENCWLN